MVKVGEWIDVCGRKILVLWSGGNKIVFFCPKENNDDQIFLSDLKFSFMLKIKDPRIALMIYFWENLEYYKTRIGFDNI